MTKTKTINLAEETVRTISTFLGLKTIRSVLDREFADISVKQDVDREKTKLYAAKNRGSVRLNSGRYYTVRELEEREERIRALELP